MARYILRRLGFIALTMLLASILIFAATQVIPGDIATMILGRFATEQAKFSSARGARASTARSSSSTSTGSGASSAATGAGR